MFQYTVQGPAGGTSSSTSADPSTLPGMAMCFSRLKIAGRLVEDQVAPCASAPFLGLNDGKQVGDEAVFEDIGLAIETRRLGSFAFAITVSDPAGCRSPGMPAAPCPAPFDQPVPAG